MTRKRRSCLRFVIAFADGHLFNLSSFQLKSGPHEAITDPDMKAIWKEIVRSLICFIGRSSTDVTLFTVRQGV